MKRLFIFLLFTIPFNNIILSQNNCLFNTVIMDTLNSLLDKPITVYKLESNVIDPCSDRKGTPRIIKMEPLYYIVNEYLRISPSEAAEIFEYAYNTTINGFHISTLRLPRRSFDPCDFDEFNYKLISETDAFRLEDEACFYATNEHDTISCRPIRLFFSDIVPLGENYSLVLVKVTLGLHIGIDKYYYYIFFKHQDIWNLSKCVLLDQRGKPQ